jgi:predicted DCC family thiol-disulfide oxidoreductase YuxK
MLDADVRKAFRYAPLQGTTAAERLGSERAAKLASLALADETGIYEKSDAVLRILAGLGGLWRLITMFRVVPRSLRDAAYDFIARNRYRWFGKRDTCRMPLPGERERFLP